MDLSLGQTGGFVVLASPCGSVERALGNLSDGIALLHVGKLLGKKKDQLIFGDHIVL